MAIFDDVKNAISSAAQSVSSMTKDSVEISRLSNEARNATNELNGTYTQIGRAFVDANGEITETIESLCARAKELKAKITSLEQQKMALRNQRSCPSCGAVMGKNARFCSNCGTQLPEVETPAPVEEKAPDITYCPSCGAIRKNNDPYCDICGFCYDADDSSDDDSVIISAPVVGEAVAETDDEFPGDTDSE